MRFFLTGGGGYLGGRLAGHLEQQGHRVSISSRRPSGAAGGHDITSPGASLPEGCEAVVHLASPDQTAAGSNPESFLSVSAALAWRVCELAVRLDPPPRLLFVSTVHVYGKSPAGALTELTPPRPHHPYALGKYLGEEIVRYFARSHGLQAVCLRLSNVFGAPASPAISQWHLLFNDLCRQAVAAGELNIRTAGQKRNFITMTDAVRAIEFLASPAMALPADGVMNVGSRLSYTVAEAAVLVAERARATLGREVAIRLPEAPGECAPDFTLSIERLQNAGFEWQGRPESEIDETLAYCARVFG